MSYELSTEEAVLAMYCCVHLQMIGRLETCGSGYVITDGKRASENTHNGYLYMLRLNSLTLQMTLYPSIQSKICFQSGLQGSDPCSRSLGLCSR